MALDVASFKVVFPEFTDAGDTMIALYIQDASQRVNVAFGSLFDRAHAIMTAKMLAQSSFGQQARLLSKTGRSTYDDQWDNLAYTFNAGGTVL